MTCFVLFIIYTTDAAMWFFFSLEKQDKTHLGITIQSNDAVSIHLISHYYEGARKNYNRFAYLTEKNNPTYPI